MNFKNSEQLLPDSYYEQLPNNLGDSVKRYVELGIQPGSFLSAVIENNLRDSFRYADDNNQRDLFEIVKWFYKKMPIALWGSKQNAIDWAKTKGRAWE